VYICPRQTHAHPTGHFLIQQQAPNAGSLRCSPPGRTQGAMGEQRAQELGLKARGTVAPKLWLWS